MNLNSEISWEEVEKLVNEIIFEIYRRRLTDIETKILQGAYEKKKYGQIEDERSDNYLKEVGKRIWDVLTGKLGEKVNKSNFVQALLQYKIKQNLEEDSEIYIKRDNVDSLYEKEIIKPGALIHIKSPPKMGKTLLLGRLLDYAASQKHCQIAKLDLHFADIDASTELKPFAIWLCDEIFYALYPDDTEEMKEKRKECQENFVKVDGNLTRFFQMYLLPKIEGTLVLAIDAFEKSFNYTFISTFCSYLRGWHEKAKSTDRIGILWRKLRIVLVYSTAETFPTLQTNLSPFNVGVAFNLPNFSDTEVNQLAERYGLDKVLEGNDVKRLFNFVDGHPYFIQKAFTDIKNKSTNPLNNFLELAPTEQGIYSDDLRQQLQNLMKKNLKKEGIIAAYKKVLEAKENGINLGDIEIEFAFELQYMGLVKFEKNKYCVANKLYEQYFSATLL